MSAFNCDLHIHSCLSPCGDEEMTPGNIAGVAKLNGLNIAALTDHNTCANCASPLTTATSSGSNNSANAWASTCAAAERTGLGSAGLPAARVRSAISGARPPCRAAACCAVWASIWD